MTAQTYAQPLRIFIGYDHRQAISYNVLQFSLFRRCTKPVMISPPARVRSFSSRVKSVVVFRKQTEPSANNLFAPPGWKL